MGGHARIAAAAESSDDAAMPYYPSQTVGDLQHDVASCWHCLKRLYALVQYVRKRKKR
jgi:hypothetical protein